MADALDADISRASAILGRSRNAVVAGMSTDVAGTEAAVALAGRIGAAIDHLDAGAALRDLGVMRTAGWLVTTPFQARAQADVILLVGRGHVDAWPDIATRLALAAAPSLAPSTRRRVIHLCPGGPPLPAADAVGASEPHLVAVLGVLRAVVAGHPIATEDLALRSCAETLAAARFGVAVWSASTVDALAVEMLCGLIDDLNARTRFAGLPLAPRGNAAGVAQATAWTTGFPFRTGFAGGTPEHDPWRFDAARMVESGEADAVLWIAANDATPPPWQRRVPTIVLASAPIDLALKPEVAIAVGCPGVDHDAVLYDPALAALSWHSASAPTSTPAVADVLARIIAGLPC